MIRYVDLRTHSPGSAAELLNAVSTEGAYITAWQAAALGNALHSKPVVITAPDFLNYARLLNTGQGKALASLPGGFIQSGLAGAQAGLQSLPRTPQLVAMDFWAIAEVLLRYDLALIPKHYTGPVCLHSHLMDFAAVFERDHYVRMFFRLTGSRAGVHTQQLAPALSCLARWQLAPALLSFLCTTGDMTGNTALAAAGRTNLLTNTKLVAEMDSWPADLQTTDVAHQHSVPELHGILTALNRQV